MNGNEVVRMRLTCYECSKFNQSIRCCSLDAGVSVVPCIKFDRKKDNIETKKQGLGCGDKAHCSLRCAYC